LFVSVLIVLVFILVLIVHSYALSQPMSLFKNNCYNLAVKCKTSSPLNVELEIQFTPIQVSQQHITSSAVIVKVKV